MSNYEDNQKVLDRITPELGKEIGEAARGGNEYAKRVITLYEIVHARPENAAIALLGCALDEYEKMRPVEEEVNGGGKIVSLPYADMLKPVTKCECLWGKNECPNPFAWVIVCTTVRGFTVACEPHAQNFAQNVDPHNGDYTYVTPAQFERMKESGLYTAVSTYRDWYKCVTKGLVSFDYETLREQGVFP